MAIDIGLIGPDYDGNERTVSICVKDNFSPYDRNLTGKLIAEAEANDIKHAIDIFYRYGTDANAAVRAGNNVRGAAFGMACYCSHGMERTHLDGVVDCKAGSGLHDGLEIISKSAAESATENKKG